MAISFSYADGLLMKALGRVGAVIKNQDADLAVQFAALVDDVTGITAQLEDEPDVQAVVGAGYISALQGAGGPLGSLMRQQAAAVVNRYVYRDSPRVAQTLTSSSTLASLQEIARQMRQQGQTVLAQTVTAPEVTRVFGGQVVGDTAVLCSVRRPADGRVLENAYAETLTALCSADSFTGNATAFQESWRINGTGPQPDVFSFDWPRGSGASLIVSAADGVQDAAGGNLLTNSGFDSWTDGLPDGWELLTGTAGTQISQDTGVVCRGASSLKVTGSGGVQIRLRRAVAGLSALSQYGLCLWMQRDGVVAAAGSLTVGLYDGGGTVLEDGSGNDCVVTVDLTALPTLYAPFGGPVRTPRAMPDEVFIEIRTPTAVTNGRSVYVDLMSLAGQAQMYVGGPFVSSHSGGAAPAVNDQGQIVVTNSRGAAGTLSSWQTLFFRLFPDVVAAELLLPSDAAPSISDSWIA